MRKRNHSKAQDVKCKEKGIPVHADVRVKSGHVFRYVQNVL